MTAVQLASVRDAGPAPPWCENMSSGGGELRFVVRLVEDQFGLHRIGLSAAV